MDKKKLAILIAAVFSAALLLTGCGIGQQRIQAPPDGQRSDGREEAATEAEKTAEEAEKDEKRAEEAEEAREEAESRASAEEATGQEEAGSSEDSSEGPSEGSGRQGGVTLEVGGEPGTEFSGSCAVGDQGGGEPIAGRVPQAFEFRTGGEELECRIRNESGGELKVVLASGDDRSAQSVDARGATIGLAYSDDALSSRTSSTSSGGGGGGSGGSQSVSSSSSSMSSHQSGGGSSRQSSSQSSRQVVVGSD